MSTGLSRLFSFGAVSDKVEMPLLFPMQVLQADFVRTDVRNLYAKILTDTLERTEGIPQDKQQILWDNCLAGESSKGLVTLLSEAMEAKSDLILVYNKALGTIRTATGTESAQIKADYAKQAKSSLGVYVSFKNYDRTDMIKLYTSLEYCVIASLNKTMNLSKSVQFKMSNLRGSTSLSDSGDVKIQAVEIANALRDGKDVLVDEKDVIETAKPDLTAVKEGMMFVSAKRSYYLGMPLSYITGEQTTGIGSTGEADTKAIDRGLRAYFFSIVKPVVEAIFGVKVSFSAYDFSNVDAAMNVLKTFDLVSEEFISPENKLLVVNKILGVDSKLGEKPKEIAPTAPDPFGQPNPQKQPEKPVTQ